MMMTVAAITTSNIRNWIRTSDLDNLELVVLEGHGQKLLTENASDNKIRQFLKSVPGYIVSCAHFVSRGNNKPIQSNYFYFQQKIETVHKAVAKGSLREVQALLGKKKLAISKDENGTGLLHKAVYYNHRYHPLVTGILRCTDLTISRDIVDWLVDKYPESMGVRDNVSTNYHILRLGPLLMYTRHHRSDHDQEIIIPQTIFIYTFSTFC